MMKKDTTRAQKYASLRKRGQRELRNLDRLYASLDDEDQKGARGKRIREQQAWIREASNETRLRGKNSPKERLKSAAAANRLESLIPERYGGRNRQEREDRMFRSQVRYEEEYGMPTATYGGEAGTGHYERIFYMSTESIWSGAAPEDRDKLIMKELGVDSLEEAYEIIMSANEEAIAEMRRRSGGSFTKWQRGDSDPIMAFIVNAAQIAADRRNN